MIRQPIVLAIVFAIIAPATLSPPAQATPLSQSIAQKRFSDAAPPPRPAIPGKPGGTTGQNQPGPGQGRPTPLNPDR